MSSLDEKRVHDPDSEPERALLASETGAALVSIAAGRVGSTSLAHREPAADVATDGDRVVLASKEDVLELGAEGMKELGYGPASAVAIDDRSRVLAAEGEHLARRADGEWHSIEPSGSVGEIRAIDGDLVASAEGIYRIEGESLRYSGLEGARDVTSAGAPHAATDAGLYALGNGWLEVIEGAFETVSADPGSSSPGALGRAHAVDAEGCYEHSEGSWRRRALPGQQPVVDVAYGETVYAVTEDGILLIEDEPGERNGEGGTDEDDEGGEEGESGEIEETKGTRRDERGWRTHPLGLRGVRALSIVR